MPQIDIITLFSQVYHSTMFFLSFLWVLCFYLLPQYIIHFFFVKNLCGFLNIYLKTIKLIVTLVIVQRLHIETKVNKKFFLFTEKKTQSSDINFILKLSNFTLIESKKKALSPFKRLKRVINKNNLYLFFYSKLCLLFLNTNKFKFIFSLQSILSKSHLKKKYKVKKYINLLLKAS